MDETIRVKLKKPYGWASVGDEVVLRNELVPNQYTHLESGYYTDQPVKDYGRCFVFKDDFEIIEEQTVQNSNSEYDNVTKPLHYHQNGLDPLTVMKYTFTKEQRVGFAKGNALKYLMRYDKKNGVEDLRKALFYINELIELEGE